MQHRPDCGAWPPEFTAQILPFFVGCYTEKPYVDKLQMFISISYNAPSASPSQSHTLQRFTYPDFSHAHHLQYMALRGPVLVGIKLAEVERTRGLARWGHTSLLHTFYWLKFNPLPNYKGHRRGLVWRSPVAVNVSFSLLKHLSPKSHLQVIHSLIHQICLWPCMVW